MEVRNKGFPNDNEIKISKTLVTILCTGIFILLFGNVGVKAWVNCLKHGWSSHDFSSGCPSKSVTCSHSGSKGSCTSTGYGSSHNSTTDYNETYHWTYCSKCNGNKSSKSSHSYTYSGYSSNGDGTHQPSSRSCWCGDTDTNLTWSNYKSNCDYGTNNKCKICNYQKPTVHTHTWSGNKCTGRSCTGCTATEAAVGHNADNNGKCSYCQTCYSYLMNGHHSWKWEKVDETYCKRVQCTTCFKNASGDTANPEKHKFSDYGTCQNYGCGFTKELHKDGTCCTSHKCGGQTDCGCTAVGEQASSCWLGTGPYTVGSWSQVSGYTYSVTFVGCKGHSCSSSSRNITLTPHETKVPFQQAPHTQKCHNTVVSWYGGECSFPCTWCNAAGVIHSTNFQLDGVETEEPPTKLKKFKKWTNNIVGDENDENAFWYHWKDNDEVCKNCGVTLDTGVVTDYDSCNTTITSISATQHQRKCSVCGFSRNYSHQWGDWENNNAGKHRHKCTICDYYSAWVDCTNTKKGDPVGSGDWVNEDATNHKKGGTQYYNPCPTCGWVKPGTDATVRQKHSDAGAYRVSVDTAWQKNADNHWHSTTLYCSVSTCNRNMGAGNKDSYGAHNNWQIVTSSYSAWSNPTSGTNSPARTRTYNANCGTCGYTKQFTETCNHTYGNWEDKDVNGNVQNWQVPASSTSEPVSKKNQRRVCSHCGYIQTQVIECNHHGHYNAKVYDPWNKNETQSSRNWTEKCNICSYVHKGTEYCNHSGKITYIQIPNNDNVHTKKCTYCEWQRDDDSHIWKDASVNNGWKQTNATNHTRTCTLCGYTETKPHNWGDWVQWGTPVNDTTHQSTCADCKLTKTENHSYTTPISDPVSVGDNGYHYDTCTTGTCGYVRKEQHTNYLYDGVGTFTSSKLGTWKNDNPSDNNQIVTSVIGTHTHYCGYRNIYNKQCPYQRTEDHTWTIVPTTKPGYTKHQCSASGCGAIQFTENSYTIHFDINGGSPSQSDISINFNGTVNLPSVSRTGYTFIGWQAYSGSDNTNLPNNTNTNILTSNNRDKLLKGIVSKLTSYTTDGLTITLVAIWEHQHPMDSVDGVTISGAKSAGGSNPSGITTAYWCDPKSVYTVTQKIINHTSPYFTGTYGINLLGATSGVTIDNNTFNDTTSGNTGWYVDFITHTLISNASIKSTVNDGVIKLQPYSTRTCSWKDNHFTCNDCVNRQNNGNQTALMFDGNEPKDDEATALWNEWNDMTNLAKHYEKIQGRVMNITATDAFGTYWSGLTNASYIKITNLYNDTITKTLDKTPVTDIYGRIQNYTFESFTIDESNPLFTDGFEIKIHLEDVVGNKFDRTYKFSGFALGIEDFGSYTFDQTPTTEFYRGEAIYVKLFTENYADKVEFKIPWDNVQYLLYVDKDMDYILNDAHIENLQVNTSDTITITTSGNPKISTTDSRCEYYLIFIVPDDWSIKNNTFKATGYKNDDPNPPKVKDASQNFTIRVDEPSITNGLHTVIKRTD